ncbi:MULTISPECIES: YlbF family regulator [Enterococcaceae]|uniref:YlbF family regulator n=1 Tax=Enterococcaceae TaxID=81852 RepID=UPI000E4DEA06|nr:MULTISPECIES: YlbF family regulator [Enterococcaceae]MCI0130155.1 YlbF family regulator [Vagococcus sp. CY53-2]RGI31018.1 YlbF family regulator [Melissococcus sp. OM08-11BH]UNM88979.1 YlbF family regulator [Vagococcus sp. CY52-2]
MIYNDELFDLEDKVNQLAKDVLNSQTVIDYLHAYQAIDKSSEVSDLVSDFLTKKEAFEKIEPYGKYAPDFKETRRALRKSKRALDTNELVATFKISETTVQNVLDYISLDIAQTISDTIKVDAGNPFFEFAKKGCGGTCHVNK